MLKRQLGSGMKGVGPALGHTCRAIAGELEAEAGDAAGQQLAHLGGDLGGGEVLHVDGPHDAQLLRVRRRGVQQWARAAMSIGMVGIDTHVGVVDGLRAAS